LAFISIDSFDCFVKLKSVFSIIHKEQKGGNPQCPQITEMCHVIDYSPWQHKIDFKITQLQFFMRVD